jgi:hypothetical protein
MWSPDDCASSGDDLEAPAEIFEMCAGDIADEGRRDDGRNASLDAIRMMLVRDFPPHNGLGDPLASLTRLVTRDLKGRKMVKELLVYGRCASDGRAREWLENFEGEDVHFLSSVLMESCKSDGLILSHGGCVLTRSVREVNGKESLLVSPSTSAVFILRLH